LITHLSGRFGETFSTKPMAHIMFCRLAVQSRSRHIRGKFLRKGFVTHCSSRFGETFPTEPMAHLMFCRLAVQSRSRHIRGEFLRKGLVTHRSSRLDSLFRNPCPVQRIPYIIFLPDFSKETAPDTFLTQKLRYWYWSK
jgi:hypothetical protein